MPPSEFVLVFKIEILENYSCALIYICHAEGSNVYSGIVDKNYPVSVVVFKRIHIRINHLEKLTRSVVSGRVLKFKPKLDARVLSIVYKFEG